MAYDGNYSNPYQTGPMNPPNDGYSPNPPYPTQYEERINMPQPQMPTGPPAPNPELYPEPRYQAQNQNHNPGAINDAVNSAVHNSGSTGYLSPEVLSQITATVIQQLKSTGLDNLQGSPSVPGPPPPRSQSQQPAWQTEPSVRPHAESPPTMAARSNSIPPSVPVSRDSKEPFQPYVEPYVESEYGDTRPSPKPSPDPASERRGSMSSQESARSHHKMEARPKPPDRDATVTEMTTLERIWGKLFEDGKPTNRLGQFLRGIALHLIEDYPPGNTIVIVPHKLQKFYKDTHVSSDSYPWHDIFDDRTSSISRLFRDVEAEHHLVQDKLGERPDIPGLTPKGFERWATLMILAHPEREYERLQKAVLNMPISNPDDKKERFPKEIPRRLFPDIGDLKIREEIENQMMKQCGVDLPEITDEERDEATRSRRSPTSTTSSTERTHSYERGRPPPAKSSPPAAKSRVRTASTSPVMIDDEEETIPSAPIERERKPYRATPGGGKVYEGPGSGSGSGSGSQAPSHNHSGSFSTPRQSDTSIKSHPPPQSRALMPDGYDRDSLYARTGSGSGSGPGTTPGRRFSRSSRSSSRSVNQRTGDYRHSESDLLGRDREREHLPRYGGVSAQDLQYMESPTSVSPEVDEPRRFYHHRGSSARPDEDYYRGMLGGQGGGPVHTHGQGYDKYYR